MKPLDIFICAYLRPMFTEQTLIYLKERTKYPYRLFVIDNGGNEDITETYKDDIFMTIKLSKNAGVTAAWQIAQSLAESEYFITSDSDIYVPDLEPDWLTRMVEFMEKDHQWGAISLHPHILIGDASFSPDDPEDVLEVPWCGSVMRIMRRDAVKKVNGWADEPEALIRGDRGHEERTICGRLQEAGYKVGRTTRIRAYHPFGRNILDEEGKPIGNWGYPKNISPQEQGHNPELAEYVQQFDNQEDYDPKTWLPK